MDNGELCYIYTHIPLGAQANDNHILLQDGIGPYTKTWSPDLFRVLIRWTKSAFSISDDSWEVKISCQALNCYIVSTITYRGTLKTLGFCGFCSHIPDDNQGCELMQLTWGVGPDCWSSSQGTGGSAGQGMVYCTKTWTGSSTWGRWDARSFCSQSNPHLYLWIWYRCRVEIWALRFTVFCRSWIHPANRHLITKKSYTLLNISSRHNPYLKDCTVDFSLDFYHGPQFIWVRVNQSNLDWAVFHHFPCKSFWWSHSFAESALPVFSCSSH